MIDWALTIDISCKCDQLPAASTAVRVVALLIVFKQLCIIYPMVKGGHAVNHKTFAVLLELALEIRALEEGELSTGKPHCKQLPIEEPPNVLVGARC